MAHVHSRRPRIFSGPGQSLILGMRRQSHQGEEVTQCQSLLQPQFSRLNASAQPVAAQLNILLAQVILKDLPPTLPQVSWQMRYYHSCTALPPKAVPWLLPFSSLKPNVPASKCFSSPCQYPVGLHSFGLGAMSQRQSKMNMKKNFLSPVGTITLSAFSR